MSGKNSRGVKRRRRCIHEEVADILEYLYAAPRARASWIARYCNMPYDRAKKLLEAMSERGLTSKSVGEGATTYSVDERGYVYLELWREIRSIVRF